MKQSFIYKYKLYASSDKWFKNAVFFFFLSSTVYRFVFRYKHFFFRSDKKTKMDDQVSKFKKKSFATINSKTIYHPIESCGKSIYPYRI